MLTVHTTRVGSTGRVQENDADIVIVITIVVSIGNSYYCDFNYISDKHGMCTAFVSRSENCPVFTPRRTTGSRARRIGTRLARFTSPSSSSCGIGKYMYMYGYMDCLYRCNE